MIIRTFIFSIVCLFTTFFVFPKQICRDKKNVFLINTIESKNSYISYVVIDGDNYIVKQKKDASQEFLVVRDALAAYIAKPLSIAHSAEIIPSTKDFAGKKHAKSPGLILTIAAGATVRAQPESKYHKLCLKQRNLDEDLLPHRWFTETIIDQMTWHWQIPIIIGLDLFICNTDRHGGNLIYDPQTDSFCAIDMDAIFRRDLPAFACKKLNFMINNNKQFTREEIKALTSMRNTIQFLLDKYSPKRLIARLHYFIKQADFDKKMLHSKKMVKKIARHEKIIMESRASAYALIALLDKIINNFQQ